MEIKTIIKIDLHKFQLKLIQIINFNLGSY